MSGPLLYDFGGLVTAPGLLARDPASCIVSNNWRFPQPGVMRKRLGTRKFDTSATNDSIESLFSSKALNAQMMATTAGSKLLVGAPGVSWNTLTDIVGNNPFGLSGNHMANLGPGHYVAATNGIARVESNFSDYRRAGMPRGMAPLTYSMNPAVYTVLNGAGGFVPDGSNVAYRVTWHRKDDSGVFELGGPPTGRLVVRNIAGTSGYASAARNVSLRIPIPLELDATTYCTTLYYWRLWRSVVSATDTASDEMYLVNEAFLTATDITNGYAVSVDQTPDAFLYGQPRLHTNSSNFPPLEAGTLNGQTFADDPPPCSAVDIAAWANCMWYAAGTDRALLNLTLISASFTAGNTITIDGIVLTAVAGAPAAAQFTIVTSLTSLSLNIEATARNMVDAYNRLAGVSSSQAYYVSQGTQAPGQMIFVGQNQHPFNAQSATAGGLFRPSIVSAVTTSPTTRGNVLKFSKPVRPDAVPVVNEITVGLAGSTIKRLMPFRERLLCWTDSGLYQVNGTDYSNFTVSLVDESLRILAPETVVVSDDVCYAWCIEGIAEISDGGASIISDRIEPTVFTAVNFAFGAFGAGAFAVTDRSAHIVQFFYSSSGLNANGLAKCDVWLEFDTRRKKWSQGFLSSNEVVGCGSTQNSSGLIVLGRQYATTPSGTNAFVFKGKTYSDPSPYSDEAITGTLTPVFSQAVFQLQAPDTDARQHWQQLLIGFEDAEQPFYIKPTVLTVYWSTDLVAPTPKGISVTSPIVRLETPALLRRATRQQVQLVHATSEHCGLIALNQSLRRAPSRFPK